MTDAVFLMATDQQRKAGLRRQFAAREDGSTMVEFALSVGVLLLAILGVMEISRMLYIYHYLSNASREATRYAIVRGTTWGTACASATAYNCTASSANVSSYVRAAAPPGIDGTLLTVTTTWPGTSPSGGTCDTSKGSNSSGCVVTVKATYAFSFVAKIFTATGPTLSASASSMITQ